MVMKIIEVLGGLLGQPIVEKLMTAVGDKNKFEADINNFLQHQQRLTQLDIFRFDNRENAQGLSIESLYTPVRFKQVRDTISDRFNQEMNVQEMLDDLKHKDIFDKILITGSTGTGKSTFVKYIVKIFNKYKESVNIKKFESSDGNIQLVDAPFEGYFVPILINLVDLEKMITQSKNVNWQNDFHLEQFLSSKNSFGVNTPNFYKNLLEKTPCLILLDGFDEVPSFIKIEGQELSFAPNVITWILDRIHVLSHANKDARFILTSREIPSEAVLRKFQLFELLPFNDIEIDNLIDSWYAGYESDIKQILPLLGDRKKATKTEYDGILNELPQSKKDFKEYLFSYEIANIKQSPLLISFMLKIQTIDKQGFKNKNVHDLYKQFIALLLHDWDRIKGVHAPVNKLLTEINIYSKTISVVLEQIALLFSQQQVYTLPARSFLPIVEEALQSINPEIDNLSIKSAAIDLLKALSSRGSGIFCTDEVLNDFPETYFKFTMTSFQEYLTAVALDKYQNESEIACLMDKMKDEHAFWHKILNFFVDIPSKSLNHFFEVFITTFSASTDIDKLARFTDYFLHVKDRNYDLEFDFIDKLLTILFQNQDEETICVCFQCLYKLNGYMNKLATKLLDKPKNDLDAIRICLAFHLYMKETYHNYNTIKDIFRAKMINYRYNTFNIIEITNILSFAIDYKDAQIIETALAGTDNLDDFNLFLFLLDFLDALKSFDTPFYNEKDFYQLEELAKSLSLEKLVQFNKQKYIQDIYYINYYMNLSSFKQQFDANINESQKAKIKDVLFHNLMIFKGLSIDKKIKLFHN
jgi:energy-coupling factor transporter ATP-binding protein EcfA2